jgi:hypothetical protein
VITGEGPGHVRDQRGGAPVDQAEQLLADEPGIGHIDGLREGHDGLLPGPPDRAGIRGHASQRTAAWPPRLAETDPLPAGRRLVVDPAEFGGEIWHVPDVGFA